MNSFLIILVLFFVVNCSRRSIFELVANGEVNPDEVFFTEEYIQKVKNDVEKEGLGWKVVDFHESPFKGWTHGDLMGKISEPLSMKYHHEKTINELKAKNFTWKNKNEINRRSIPTSYIFYYPGKSGSYQDCYDTTNNPVRDQKSCGSCYAFASVQVFDDMVCKRNKDNGFSQKAWHRGSPQSILSCNVNTGGESFGCDGGSMYSVFKSLEDDQSGMHEHECLDTYKYTSGSIDPDYACPGTTGTCEDDNTILNSDKLYCEDGSTSYYWSYPFSDGQQAILDYGPITSAFDVYSDFYSYSSGVYTKSSSATYKGGHAIEVLGWGYEGSTPVWYCKNSWGDDWGYLGFFMIERSLTDGSDLSDGNGVEFAKYFNGCTIKIGEYGCYGVASDRSYVCSGHGSCVADNTCSCDSGWGGSNCQNVVTTTCSPTCNAANGGVCNEGGTTDYCTCDDGWYADDGCNTATCNGILAGTSGVCNNHGTCSGANSCSCDSGYYGTYCDKTITCSPSCQNGGTCKAKSDNSGTYCDCSSTGYEGSYCQTPTCAQTCQNGGSCSAPNTCTCVNDWEGSDCSTATCSPSCQNGGSCNAPNKCSCTSNWSGDSCETPVCTYSCANGGSCINPPTCTCVNDYYGDDCKSFDCNSNPCQNGGSCTGPNTCSCINGWTGTTCTSFSCSQTCQNGGSCVAPDTCSCINEWDGDDCSEYTCSPKCGTHGKCTSPNVCSCSDSYTGSTCEEFSCSKTCQNGGSCIAPDTCDCPAGYIGEDCSILACYDIAATSSNVCSGHGTCSAPNTCDCILSDTENYKGDECETFFVPNVYCNGILSSEDNACNGKGSCVGENDCICIQGYTGEFCQLTVHCDSIYSYNTSFVCSGNGFCIVNEENNPVGICQCNSGYEGQYCSQIQDFTAAITTGVMIAALIGGGCVLLLIIAIIAVVIAFGIRLVLAKKNRDSIRQEGGFSDMKFYELNDEKSDEETNQIEQPKLFVPKNKPSPPIKQQSFGNGFRKQGPPSIPKKKFSPPMLPKKKIAPPMIPKKSINNAGRFQRRTAGGFKKANSPPMIPKKVQLRPTKKLVPKKKFGGRMPPKLPMKFRKAKPPMIPKKQPMGFKKSPPMIPKKLMHKKVPPMLPKKRIKKKTPPIVPRRGKLQMNSNRLRVVQRYNSTRGDELTVLKGEILTLLKREDDGWVLVRNSRGKQGYVPGNFCK